MTFAFLKTFYSVTSNFILCMLLFIIVKYIHDKFLCKFTSFFSVLFTSKNIFWRISPLNSFSRLSYSGFIMSCDRFIGMIKYSKTSTNSAIWLDGTVSNHWENRSKYCFSVASLLSLPTMARKHVLALQKMKNGLFLCNVVFFGTLLELRMGALPLDFVCSLENFLTC